MKINNLKPGDEVTFNQDIIRLHEPILKRKGQTVIVSEVVRFKRNAYCQKKDHINYIRVKGDDMGYYPDEFDYQVNMFGG